MTTELLTVRLNSVNDILALQEEEMVEKVFEPCLCVHSPTADAKSSYFFQIFD